MSLLGSLRLLWYSVDQGGKKHNMYWIMVLACWNEPMCFEDAASSQASS